MKLGKYIVGLLSGLTFGMLFAPKKGRELRKELAKKTSGSDPYSSCHEGAKVIGKAFKDAGEEAWAELRSLGENEQVAALVELSQEKMKEFLDTAEEKGYDVASYVQEKLEGLASLAKTKAKGVSGMAVKHAAATKKKVGKKVRRKVSAAKKKVGRKAAKSTKRAAKAVTKIRRIKK